MLQEHKDRLEWIVDAASVGEVLMALVEICNLKAEHVQEHWHDSNMAAGWRADARTIENIINKVEN